MSQIIGSIMDLGVPEGTALALADELQKGWRYNVATTKARERAAAMEAKALRENQRRATTLRPVLCMDQQQYFEMVAKYGHDAFNDRGFIRDMHRHCPETKAGNL
jgi:hypothetical protein